MTHRGFAAAALVACVAASACRQPDPARAARADSGVLAQRETRLERSLSQADTAAPDSTADRKAIARWVLPRNLAELSGIALTHDGRLLAHGDEKAQVSEIDYRRGIVTKQFVVGHPTVKADLEAITVADGFVYLLASNGTLYEFHEGANGERVDYTTRDTRLGKECEFEGLAFDSTLNSLLLACKQVGTKHLKDDLVIYRWKLEGSGDRLSRLTVPLKDIRRTDRREAIPSVGHHDRSLHGRLRAHLRDRDGDGRDHPQRARGVRPQAPRMVTNSRSPSRSRKTVS